MAGGGLREQSSSRRTTHTREPSALESDTGELRMYLEQLLGGEGDRAGKKHTVYSVLTRFKKHICCVMNRTG